MASRRDKKQFHFAMWMENYIYLNDLASEQREDMTRLLNQMIAAHKDKFEKLVPVSRREQ